jgi:hypothetical protein
VEYYNQERPHQSKGNRPLGVADAPVTVPFGATRIICERRLGGLLKHYRYAAEQHHAGRNPAFLRT